MQITWKQFQSLNNSQGCWQAFGSDSWVQVFRSKFQALSPSLKSLPGEFQALSPSPNLKNAIVRCFSTSIDMFQQVPGFKSFCYLNTKWYQWQSPSCALCVSIALPFLSFLDPMKRIGKFSSKHNSRGKCFCLFFVICLLAALHWIMIL